MSLLPREKIDLGKVQPKIGGKVRPAGRSCPNQNIFHQIHV